MPQPAHPLPAAPNLEHLRHQARDLRKACSAGQSEALARVEAAIAPKHARRADNTVKPISLSEAQLVIAREHGFPSWPRLKSYVDRISGPNSTRHRPLSPRLDYYEGRAAGLLTAFRDGLPEVEQQIREVFPLALEPGSLFDLGAAREVIAREHAFPSWRQLKRHLASIERGETVEPFITALNAIEAGDMPALEAALRHDPSLVRAAGTNGNNLLGIAASSRRLDMVRLLLSLGADVNSGNRYGWTALHQAGYSSNVELVKLLLEAGASTGLSARGTGGTPLVVALFWGHREAAALLAQNGIQPCNLRAAAGAGRVDIVSACFHPGGALTQAAGAERGFYRPHGGFPEWTPTGDRQQIVDEAFVYAARNGQLEVLPLLLQQGADINADPYRGTALTWAAHGNRTETLEYLLQHGADVNRRGTFGGPAHGQGVTALQIAAQCGHEQSARLLLEHGADPTLRDDLYNGPAAGWARSGGHESLAAYLETVA